MSDKRGLVISCPLDISPHGLMVKQSLLDPQELRFSLLFWDRLDYPANNIFRFPLGPDGEFLQSSGVLQRTRINLDSFSGNPGDAIRTVHVGAYRTLEKSEPGVWSLATGPRSVSFLERDLEEKRGALVRLYHAIPVPDK